MLSYSTEVHIIVKSSLIEVFYNGIFLAKGYLEFFSEKFLEKPLIFLPCGTYTDSTSIKRNQGFSNSFIMCFP
jgi:hypothetical protein